jgi:GAF domain-containing protein
MIMEDKMAIEMLRAVNRSIASSNDLVEIAMGIAQLLVGILGIKGCTIFAFNPDTQELETIGSFGLSIRYLNKGPILVKKSLYPQLKDGPILIADVSVSDKLQYHSDAIKEGIRSIIAIPIRMNQRNIGALRLYHYETWEAAPKDIEFLELVADHIGLAMTYKRLQQTLRAIRTAMGQIHPIWLDET